MRRAAAPHHPHRLSHTEEALANQGPRLEIGRGVMAIEQLFQPHQSTNRLRPDSAPKKHENLRGCLQERSSHFPTVSRHVH
jgi:hypothetical protein